MDVLASQGQAGKEQNLPSPMSLYRLPEEGMAQIRGLPSDFKIQIKDVCFPASKVCTRGGFTHFKPRKKVINKKQTNLSQVCPPFLEL